MVIFPFHTGIIIILIIIIIIKQNEYVHEYGDYKTIFRTSLARNKKQFSIFASFNNFWFPINWMAFL